MVNGDCFVAVSAVLWHVQYCTRLDISGFTGWAVALKLSKAGTSMRACASAGPVYRQSTD